MSTAIDNLVDSKPTRLARLFELDTGNAERVWRPDELGAILRHQLAAPVQYDLRNLDRGEAGKLKRLAEAEGLILRSFGDLLHHPHPPIELLRMTKDFAKACRISPTGPLPPEIATVIYYAAIVVARQRCGLRISKLNDADLRHGLEHVLAQAWLDSDTRALFAEALKRLPANDAKEEGSGREKPANHANGHELD
jgi:hypothetical protein